MMHQYLGQLPLIRLLTIVYAVEVEISPTAWSEPASIVFSMMFNPATQKPLVAVCGDVARDCPHGRKASIFVADSEERDLGLVLDGREVICKGVERVVFCIWNFCHSLCKRDK